MTNQVNNAPAGATHHSGFGVGTKWYRDQGEALGEWRDGGWGLTGYPNAAAFNKANVGFDYLIPLSADTSSAEDQTVMATEDDLTWLVRESRGEWFGSHPTHIARDGDLLTWATFPRLPEGYRWFTKAEYLARRAELQNKPGWDDAPEWAEFLIQTMAGWWLWLSDEPNYMDDLGIMRFHSDVNSEKASEGELLGDWRDTLEKRPEPQSPVDMAMSIIGADSLDHFSADELADLHQICDAELTKRDATVCGGQKYLDATWHERGALPPVGAECVIWSDGRFPPEECKIVAYSMEQVCVRWNGSGDLDVIDLQFKNPSECKFRPIRTERDEAIEAMKAHCPYPGSWETTYRLFAESLYDAGYRAGCSE